MAGGHQKVKNGIFSVYGRGWTLKVFKSRFGKNTITIALFKRDSGMRKCVLKEQWHEKVCFKGTVA